MIDITSVSSDLQIMDAQTPKAANVLMVQLGELEYAPEFGIDIEFFIDPDLQFQNESFKSYLIQRLAEHHVNVSQVIEALNAFVLNYTFIVGDENKQTGGFIK
jgi:hypothetical protein